jgi:hypothetical protein
MIARKQIKLDFTVAREALGDDGPSEDTAITLILSYETYLF